MQSCQASEAVDSEERARGGLRADQDDVVGAVTFALVGGWGASLHDPGMGQLFISIERTC